MPPETKAVSEKDRVIIFDTTLRDGEQSPGASMTMEEKLRVADLLDEMGVDIIEAGFPIASQAISRACRRSPAARRSRSSPASPAPSPATSPAPASVRPAKRPRIHTFVSTSPIHLEHQMRKSADEVLPIISATVAQARNLVEDVEWSAMDATRTPIDYLCRCVEAAIKAGATTINLPDTVGYTVPKNTPPCFVPCASACRTPTRRSSPHTATTTSASRSPIRWPASPAAPARSSAPSTAGRARRQRRAGRDRHGHPHPRRRAALHHRRRGDHADARLQARLGGLRLPGAVQQGGGRQERLRPRVRHPPGRRPQARADLRDHDARPPSA